MVVRNGKMASVKTLKIGDFTGMRTICEHAWEH